MFGFLLPKSYKQGLEFYRSSNYAEAVESFSHAIQEQPENAAFHFKLGMCYFKLKQWDKAYASIKKATDLDPKKSEWLVQLEHSKKMAGQKPAVKEPAANKPAASKPAASKPAVKKPAAKKPDAVIQDYQRIMLGRDLLSLGKFVDSVDAIRQLGLTSEIFVDKGSRKKQIMLLDAERYVSENNQSDLLVIIKKMIDAGFDDVALYYKAVSAYLSSDYQKCINLIQVYLYIFPKSSSGSYLLASAAAHNQDFSTAWEALKREASQSKRELVWRYLSSLVKDGNDGWRLLSIFQDCLKVGTIKGFQRYATKSIVDGVIQGGNFPLAKKMTLDAFQAVKESPDPGSIAKNTVSYVKEDYLPEWLLPIEEIEFDSIQNNQERFKYVLARTSKILNQAGIKSFCIRKTLLAIERGAFNLAFPGDVELGVFGEKALSAAEMALRDSGEFLISVRQDSCSIRFKHFMGITVSVAQHEIHGETVRHNHCGIDFVNKSFALKKIKFMDVGIRVPEDSRTYLNEYFFEWESAAADFEICLNSQNILAITNSELLEIRVYQRLIEAIIQGNPTVEAACVNRLRKLGEKSFIDKFYQEPVGCQVQDLMNLYQSRPEVVLYLSGLENVAYQGNMWLPVLERLDVRSAIVIREKRIAEQLLPTEIPVFFMETMRDLELLESTGVKTILYPANPQKNAQTLRFFRLNHFFINHGESDKVVNQSKFLMAYDKLLVAGPMAEGRMREAGLPLRPEQVVHVGRPQVELLLNRMSEGGSPTRNILYAPTWEGFVEEANYSSVNPFGLAMLKQLSMLKDVHVYFKPHPYTGHNKKGENGAYLLQMKEFAQTHGMTVVDSREPIFDYMNLSDLMITDISSVLNDYLFTWKPMILTNPRAQSISTLHKDYPSTPATYVMDDPVMIGKLLMDINQNDVLLDVRKDICRQSLGDIPEGSMVKFNRVVVESVRGVVPSAIPDHTSLADPLTANPEQKLPVAELA